MLAMTSSLVTVVVMIVALEIYYRIRIRSAPVDPYALSFYSTQGQKISSLNGPLRLSMNPFTIYLNSPSQRTNAFVINSHALRNEEGVENDPRPKIIVLGGSSAFGLGLASNEETIPYLLQQSMPSHCVLNAGVVGFLSTQELTYLVTELIDYRPAAVVAYNGWNDLFVPLLEPARQPEKLGFSNSFYDMQDRLAQQFQNESSVSSCFAEFARTVSTKSFAITRLLTAFHNTPPLSSRCPGAESHDLSEARKLRRRSMIGPIVDLYVSNMVKMSKISRAYGAVFIVVLQPEIGQKAPTEFETKVIHAFDKFCYSQDFPELYREFIATAKQRLSLAGIAWIDINESKSFTESTETLFIDPVHTNRTANEKVVRLIQPELKLMLAVASSQSPQNPGR